MILLGITSDEPTLVTTLLCDAVAFDLFAFNL